MHHAAANALSSPPLTFPSAAAAPTAAAAAELSAPLLKGLGQKAVEPAVLQVLRPQAAGVGPVSPGPRARPRPRPRPRGGLVGGPPGAMPRAQAGPPGHGGGGHQGQRGLGGGGQGGDPAGLRDPQARALQEQNAARH